MSARATPRPRASPAAEAAIAQCCDAVLAPNIWPQALEALAQAFGGIGACIHPKGVGSRLAPPASPKYADLLREFVSNGWASHDLRSQRGWRIVEAGASVVREDDVSTPQERRASPLYQELFAAHDMTLFAGVGTMIDGQPWAVNAVRGDRQGPFDKRELANLRRARPALGQMLRFATRASGAAAASAVAALEAAAQPAILLDWHGRVAAASGSATALFGDRLDVRGGRLAARLPQTDAPLQALIGAVLRGEPADPVVAQREGGRPLIIEAIPVRGVLADMFGVAGAYLMLTDLAARPALNQSLVRAALGLTPREAEVAAALATGRSTEEIAEGLHLRLSSVRQIIKSLLAKTGASGQVELVALLSRLRRSGPD
ncbi:MAG: helix-turn-helix transcriptional regulator [Hyphomonadaceae bacterium]|nr:helix-turn-helix transcriptional regulator [Hyphomonadaceae bacterium]